MTLRIIDIGKDSKVAVYCIADIARTVLKVGYTKDKQSAKTRMKGLQTACPFRLQLLAFCSHMTQRDEKYIHDLIKEHRLDGGTEWFSYESVTIIAEYMKFDPESTETPKEPVRTIAKPKFAQQAKARSKPKTTPKTTWADLGIIEGKEPHYSDDENDEQGYDDDTDFCPVLEECVTEYADRDGILPEWLTWPDSYYGQFPELYGKFLPMGYRPIECSRLAKHLVVGTHGENWNPSIVMAKIVAHQLCSAHFYPELGCDDEIEVYPLFNEKNPQLLLMMCFADPKECIDDIELFMDEFFWTLDDYIMGMSFLIIDKAHNYYEATHQHPLRQLTLQEIDSLRIGDAVAHSKV